MIAPSQHPPMPRPRPVRRKSSTPWLYIFGILGLMGFGTLIVAGILGGAYYYSSTRIPVGVTVAGVDVGGESVDSAAQLLQTQNPQAIVTLVDGERTWQVNLGNLGMAIDYKGTAEKALHAHKNESITPSYFVDLSQTQTGLVAMMEQVNIDAVSGDPPQMGRSLEIPVMLDRFRADTGGELADGIIELSMIEVAPPPVESVNLSNTITTTHVVTAGQELGLIAKMYGVTVEDILAVNDLANPDIISVGEELTIPAAGVYEPDASVAPAPSTTSGKAIVVSTTDQRIYAYENGQLIHSHLASTGLPGTPTVLGDYKVYVKYAATDMSGTDYFLPDVPYTMYFYQGYGIHGTYWHNSFGRPMSHGCVNLPTEEAKWFFDWAEVGTPVRVV